MFIAIRENLPSHKYDDLSALTHLQLAPLQINSAGEFCLCYLYQGGFGTFGKPWKVTGVERLAQEDWWWMDGSKVAWWQVTTEISIVSATRRNLEGSFEETKPFRRFFPCR